MSSVVMRCAGRSGPSLAPAPLGLYLAAYDPDKHDGRGEARWTGDPDAAMRFTDATAAWQCFMTVSAVRPKRDDGKPNRPLATFNIIIEPEPADPLVPPW